jgi:hypothetical protein
MGPSGQPPVEAGIVNENHGIGPMVTEKAVGAREQVKENVGVGEDAEKPHDSQLTQRIQQPAAGRFHARAAEADTFQIRTALPHFPDEIRAVQVATRFAGAEKDTHGFRASQECPRLASRGVYSSLVF